MDRKSGLQFNLLILGSLCLLFANVAEAQSDTPPLKATIAKPKKPELVGSGAGENQKNAEKATSVPVAKSPSPELFLEVYTENVVKPRIAAGERIHGRAELAKQIMFGLDEGSRIVLFEGGRDVIDAYVMDQLNPKIHGLQANVDVRRLDATKLFAAVKTESGATLDIIRSITKYIADKNKAAAKTKRPPTVLYVDSLAPYNLDSNSKAGEALLETLLVELSRSTGDIPVIIGTDSKTREDVFEKAPQLRDAATVVVDNTPKLAPLISELQDEWEKIRNRYRAERGIELNFMGDMIAEVGRIASELTGEPRKSGKRILNRVAAEFYLEQIHNRGFVVELDEKRKELISRLTHQEYYHLGTPEELQNLRDKIADYQKRIDETKAPGAAEEELAQVNQEIIEREAILNSNKLKPKESFKTKIMNQLSAIGSFMKSSQEDDATVQPEETSNTRQDNILQALKEKSAALQKEIGVEKEGPPKAITRKFLYQVASGVLKLPEKMVAGTDIDKALLDFEENVSKVVFGQTSAKKAVGDALRGVRAMKEKGVVSFLFPGPTSVGKTEMAKQTAAVLDYGFEYVSMEGFKLKESVTALIRPPPGHESAKDETSVWDKIKKLPKYSIVLFDEIEKAHPDILNLLNGAMGEGKFQNSFGEEIDLTGKVFIFTTNKGKDFWPTFEELIELETRLEAGPPHENEWQARAEKLASLGMTPDQIQDIMNSEGNIRLKKIGDAFGRYLVMIDGTRFVPEIVARFRGIIPFQTLRGHHVTDVVKKFIDLFKKQFEDARKDVDERPIKLFVTEELKKLVNSLYTPEKGVRDLNGWIKSNFGSAIARLMPRMAEVNGETQSIVLDTDGSNVNATIENVSPETIEHARIKAAQEKQGSSVVGELGDGEKRYSDKAIVERATLKGLEKFK